MLHVQNLIACLMLTWLVQVRSQFRKIFVAMGFEEMMTNAYVENRWELFSCAPHDGLALNTHALCKATAPQDNLLLVDTLAACGQTLLHSITEYPHDAEWISQIQVKHTTCSTSVRTT